MAKNNLLKELATMSSAERILLAQDLWDSVADDSDAWELTPQQKRELDRRLKAYRARKASGKSAGASWSEVKRRIRPQFTW
jgi:putative addiction module component (TIGR02574 family)